MRWSFYQGSKDYLNFYSLFASLFTAEPRALMLPILGFFCLYLNLASYILWIFSIFFIFSSSLKISFVLSNFCSSYLFTAVEIKLFLIFECNDTKESENFPTWDWENMADLFEFYLTSLNDMVFCLLVLYELCFSIFWKVSFLAKIKLSFNGNYTFLDNLGLWIILLLSTLVLKKLGTYLRLE